MGVAQIDHPDNGLWEPPATSQPRTRTAVPEAGASERAPDAVLDALAVFESEIVVLRERLTLAERALGLPAARYGPAPPDLAALLRRVRELERRSGIVPGLAPLSGLDTPPPAATVADTPAGWLGRAAWPGLVGTAVAVFLIALAVLPFPGGAPRRATESPAASCFAASPQGVPGEGCTAAATGAPLSRPAVLPVAAPTAPPTADHLRFLEENFVPFFGPDPHVPSIWDYREEHRLPVGAADPSVWSGLCPGSTGCLLDQEDHPLFYPSHNGSAR